MACGNLVVLAVIVVVLGAANASPVPDSAGIVEMPPGLAYGGIPYGSVSGMLVAPQQRIPAYYTFSNNLQADTSSILVPDTRTVF